MNKKNLILGAILILLIIFAFIYQGPIKKWQANLGKPLNFLGKVKIEEIDKIEIAKAGKITTLEKQSDKWKVGGTKNFYLSENDSKEMKDILENASRATLELISANKNNKKEFWTDESGVSVKFLADNKEKLGFIVGRPGNSGGSYISRQDLKETYFIRLDLNRVFDKDEWRDKAIFSFAKEKISKIRFQYPDREFTVEKKGNEWEGVKPKKFAVNKDKMDKILFTLSNLTAIEIPEQTFRGTGLEKHLIIIEAVNNDEKNVLMVGDKNNKDLYFAKQGNSDNIYLISKAERDELNKKIEDLK
jgi:hypothetical protein